jgi:DNA repair protein RadA/Sms
LVLQVLDRLCGQDRQGLYISGEESEAQLKLRADRLGLSSPGLLVAGETCLENIFKILEELKPSFLAIDSIQTIYTATLPAAPGSLAQVRETAFRLVQQAKLLGMATFLIGHVTKEGAIAGPRVLEHMVDTVLYFEGDRYQAYRLLRAVKNRFGPTDEIGVFEMRNTGLAEVTDLADVFVSRQRRATPGSVVVPVIEGTRALLVEVQALVSRANFGTPERKVSGLDRNRVAMLLAVLERRADLVLADHDVFVNAVGGVKVVEPAADLAAAIAIASSFTDRAVRPDLAALGEVGLAGEVRGVSQMDARLREATRLGWKVAIAPRDSARSLQGRYGELDVRLVSTLAEALEAAAS